MPREGIPLDSITTILVWGDEKAGPLSEETPSEYVEWIKLRNGEKR